MVTFFSPHRSTDLIFLVRLLAGRGPSMVAVRSGRTFMIDLIFDLARLLAGGIDLVYLHGNGNFFRCLLVFCGFLQDCITLAGAKTALLIGSKIGVVLST
jgi:hypothetical protein